ncbi:hypothetical protein ACFL35_05080 [Candidatus Riflebacteria bacterium]
MIRLNLLQEKVFERIHKFYRKKNILYFSLKSKSYPQVKLDKDERRPYLFRKSGRILTFLNEKNIYLRWDYRGKEINARHVAANFPINNIQNEALYFKEIVFRKLKNGCEFQFIPQAFFCINSLISEDRVKITPDNKKKIYTDLKIKFLKLSVDYDTFREFFEWEEPKSTIYKMHFLKFPDIVWYSQKLDGMLYFSPRIKGIGNFRNSQVKTQYDICHRLDYIAENNEELKPVIVPLIKKAQKHLKNKFKEKRENSR